MVRRRLTLSIHWQKKQYNTKKSKMSRYWKLVRPIAFKQKLYAFRLSQWIYLNSPRASFYFSETSFPWVWNGLRVGHGLIHCNPHKPTWINRQIMTFLVQNEQQRDFIYIPISHRVTFAKQVWKFDLHYLSEDHVYLSRMQRSNIIKTKHHWSNMSDAINHFKINLDKEKM